MCIRDRWCANPESFGNKRHVMFSANTCKYSSGCTACRNACPRGGLDFTEEGKPIMNWAVCKACLLYTSSNLLTELLIATKTMLLKYGNI